MDESKNLVLIKRNCPCLKDHIFVSVLTTRSLVIFRACFSNNLCCECRILQWVKIIWVSKKRWLQCRAKKNDKKCNYVTSIQDDSPVVPVQFPWRPEEGFQALADLQEHLHAVHGPGLPDCPYLEILRLPKLSVSPGLPLSGQRDGFHCLSHLECGFSTHIPADHSRRTHVETNRYIDHPKAKAKWPMGQCLYSMVGI